MPELVKESMADYHANGAIGKSMLMDFRESRRLFESKYITKTVENPPPSRAMDFGTAVHCAVLEPAEFNNLVVEIPDEVLSASGSRAGKPWKEFEAAHEGQILLNAEEIARVSKCVGSLVSRFSDWLCADHIAEHSIYWTHEPTGLACKARADMLFLRQGIAVSGDLKTTASLGNNGRQFQRVYKNLGYVYSDVHTNEGVQTLLADQGHIVMPEYRFFVVETTPPFHGISGSPKAAIYQADDYSRGAAADRRLDLLYQIAQCHDSGDWSDPDEDQTTTVFFTKWDLTNL